MELELHDKGIYIPTEGLYPTQATHGTSSIDITDFINDTPLYHKHRSKQLDIPIYSPNHSGIVNTSDNVLFQADQQQTNLTQTSYSLYNNDAYSSYEEIALHKDTIYLIQHGRVVKGYSPALQSSGLTGLGNIRAIFWGHFDLTSTSVSSLAMETTHSTVRTSDGGDELNKKDQYDLDINGNIHHQNQHNDSKDDDNFHNITLLSQPPHNINPKKLTTEITTFLYDDGHHQYDKNNNHQKIHQHQNNHILPQKLPNLDNKGESSQSNTISDNKIRITTETNTTTTILLPTSTTNFTRCLCIAYNRLIFIYHNDDKYIINTPFDIKDVWALPRGLLVQPKIPEKIIKNSFFDLDSFQDTTFTLKQVNSSNNTVIKPTHNNTQRSYGKDDFLTSIFGPSKTIQKRPNNDVYIGKDGSFIRIDDLTNISQDHAGDSSLGTSNPAPTQHTHHHDHHDDLVTGNDLLHFVLNSDTYTTNPQEELLHKFNLALENDDIEQTNQSHHSTSFNHTDSSHNHSPNQQNTQIRHHMSPQHQLDQQQDTYHQSLLSSPVQKKHSSRESISTKNNESGANLLKNDDKNPTNQSKTITQFDQYLESIDYFNSTIGTVSDGDDYSYLESDFHHFDAKIAEQNDAQLAMRDVSSYKASKPTTDQHLRRRSENISTEMLDDSDSDNNYNYYHIDPKNTNYNKNNQKRSHDFNLTGLIDLPHPTVREDNSDDDINHDDIDEANITTTMNDSSSSTDHNITNLSQNDLNTSSLSLLSASLPFSNVPSPMGFKDDEYYHTLSHSRDKFDHFNDSMYHPLDNNTDAHNSTSQYDSTNNTSQDHAFIGSKFIDHSIFKNEYVLPLNEPLLFTLLSVDEVRPVAIPMDMIDQYQTHPNDPLITNNSNLPQNNDISSKLHTHPIPVPPLSTKPIYSPFPQSTCSTSDFFSDPYHTIIHVGSSYPLILTYHIISKRHCLYSPQHPKTIVIPSTTTSSVELDKNDNVPQIGTEIIIETDPKPILDISIAPEIMFELIWVQPYPSFQASNALITLAANKSDNSTFLDLTPQHFKEFRAAVGINNELEHSSSNEGDMSIKIGGKNKHHNVRKPKRNTRTPSFSNPLLTSTDYHHLEIPAIDTINDHLHQIDSDNHNNKQRQQTSPFDLLYNNTTTTTKTEPEKLLASNVLSSFQEHNGFVLSLHYSYDNTIEMYSIKDPTTLSLPPRGINTINTTSLSYTQDGSRDKQSNLHPATSFQHNNNPITNDNNNKPLIKLVNNNHEINHLEFLSYLQHQYQVYTAESNQRFNEYIYHQGDHDQGLAQLLTGINALNNNTNLNTKNINITPLVNEDTNLSAYTINTSGYLSQYSPSIAPTSKTMASMFSEFFSQFDPKVELLIQNYHKNQNLIKNFNFASNHLNTSILSHFNKFNQPQLHNNTNIDNYNNDQLDSVLEQDMIDIPTFLKQQQQKHLVVLYALVYFFQISKKIFGLYTIESQQFKHQSRQDNQGWNKILYNLVILTGLGYQPSEIQHFVHLYQYLIQYHQIITKLQNLVEMNKNNDTNQQRTKPKVSDGSKSDKNQQSNNDIGTTSSKDDDHFSSFAQFDFSLPSHSPTTFIQSILFQAQFHQEMDKNTSKNGVKKGNKHGKNGPSDLDTKNSHEDDEYDNTQAKLTNFSRNFISKLQDIIPKSDLKSILKPSKTSFSGVSENQKPIYAASELKSDIFVLFSFFEKLRFDKILELISNSHLQTQIINFLHIISIQNYVKYILLNYISVYYPLPSILSSQTTNSTSQTNIQYHSHGLPIVNNYRNILKPVNIPFISSFLPQISSFLNIFSLEQPHTIATTSYRFHIPYILSTYFYSNPDAVKDHFSAHNIQKTSFLSYFFQKSHQMLYLLTYSLTTLSLSATAYLYSYLPTDELLGLQVSPLASCMASSQHFVSLKKYLPHLTAFTTPIDQVTNTTNHDHCDDDVATAKNDSDNNNQNDLKIQDTGNFEAVNTITHSPDSATSTQSSYKTSPLLESLAINVTGGLLLHKHNQLHLQIGPFLVTKYHLPLYPSPQSTIISEYNTDYDRYGDDSDAEEMDEGKRKTTKIIPKWIRVQFSLDNNFNRGDQPGFILSKVFFASYSGHILLSVINNSTNRSDTIMVTLPQPSVTIQRYFTPILHCFPFFIATKLWFTMDTLKSFFINTIITDHHSLAVDHTSTKDKNVTEKSHLHPDSCLTVSVTTKYPEDVDLIDQVSSSSPHKTHPDALLKPFLFGQTKLVNSHISSFNNNNVTVLYQNRSGGFIVPRYQSALISPEQIVQAEILSILFILCLYPHISPSYNVSSIELSKILQAAWIKMESKNAHGNNQNNQNDENDEKVNAFSLWEQFLSSQTHLQFASMFPTLSTSQTILVPTKEQCEELNRTNNTSTTKQPPPSPLAIIAYQLINQQMTGKAAHKDSSNGINDPSSHHYHHQQQSAQTRFYSQIDHYLHKNNLSKSLHSIISTQSLLFLVSPLVQTSYQLLYQDSLLDTRNSDISSLLGTILNIYTQSHPWIPPHTSPPLPRKYLHQLLFQLLTPITIGMIGNGGKNGQNLINFTYFNQFFLDNIIWLKSHLLFTQFTSIIKPTLVLPLDTVVYELTRHYDSHNTVAKTNNQHQKAYNLMEKYPILHFYPLKSPYCSTTKAILTILDISTKLTWPVSDHVIHHIDDIVMEFATNIVNMKLNVEKGSDNATIMDDSDVINKKATTIQQDVIVDQVLTAINNALHQPNLYITSSDNQNFQQLKLTIFGPTNDPNLTLNDTIHMASSSSHSATTDLYGDDIGDEKIPKKPSKNDQLSQHNNNNDHLETFFNTSSTSAISYKSTFFNNMSFISPKLEQKGSAPTQANTNSINNTVNPNQTNSKLAIMIPNPNTDSTPSDTKVNTIALSAFSPITYTIRQTNLQHPLVRLEQANLHILPTNHNEHRSLILDNTKDKTSFQSNDDEDDTFESESATHGFQSPIERNNRKKYNNNYDQISTPDPSAMMAGVKKQQKTHKRVSFAMSDSDDDDHDDNKTNRARNERLSNDDDKKTPRLNKNNRKSIVFSPQPPYRTTNNRDSNDNGINSYKSNFGTSSVVFKSPFLTRKIQENTHKKRNSLRNSLELSSFAQNHQNDDNLIFGKDNHQPGKGAGKESQKPSLFSPFSPQPLNKPNKQQQQQQYTSHFAPQAPHHYLNTSSSSSSSSLIAPTIAPSMGVFSSLSGFSTHSTNFYKNKTFNKNNSTAQLNKKLTPFSPFLPAMPSRVHNNKITTHVLVPETIKDRYQPLISNNNMQKILDNVRNMQTINENIDDNNTMNIANLINSTQSSMAPSLYNNTPYNLHQDLNTTNVSSYQPSLYQGSVFNTNFSSNLSSFLPSNFSSFLPSLSSIFPSKQSYLNIDPSLFLPESLVEPQSTSIPYVYTKIPSRITSKLILSIFASYDIDVEALLSLPLWVTTPFLESIVLALQSTNLINHVELPHIDIEGLKNKNEIIKNQIKNQQILQKDSKNSHKTPQNNRQLSHFDHFYNAYSQVLSTNTALQSEQLSLQTLLFLGKDDVVASFYSSMFFNSDLLQLHNNQSNPANLQNIEWYNNMTASVENIQQCVDQCAIDIVKGIINDQMETVRSDFNLKNHTLTLKNNKNENNKLNSDKSNHSASTTSTTKISPPFTIKTPSEHSFSTNHSLVLTPLPHPKPFFTETQPFANLTDGSKTTKKNIIDIFFKSDSHNNWNVVDAVIYPISTLPYQLVSTQVLTQSLENDIIRLVHDYQYNNNPNHDIFYGSSNNMVKDNDKIKPQKHTFSMNDKATVKKHTPILKVQPTTPAIPKYTQVHDDKNTHTRLNNKNKADDGNRGDNTEDQRLSPASTPLPMVSIEDTIQLPNNHITIEQDRSDLLQRWDSTTSTKIGSDKNITNSNNFEQFFKLEQDLITKIDTLNSIYPSLFSSHYDTSLSLWSNQYHFNPIFTSSYGVILHSLARSNHSNPLTLTTHHLSPTYHNHIQPTTPSYNTTSSSSSSMLIHNDNNPISSPSPSQIPPPFQFSSSSSSSSHPTIYTTTSTTHTLLPTASITSSSPLFEPPYSTYLTPFIPNTYATISSDDLDINNQTISQEPALNDFTAQIPIISGWFFPSDNRLNEVTRLLSSSRPASLYLSPYKLKMIAQRQRAEERELMHCVAERRAVLAERQLSLWAGRSMYLLSTRSALQTTGNIHFATIKSITKQFCAELCLESIVRKEGSFDINMGHWYQGVPGFYKQRQLNTISHLLSLPITRSQLNSTRRLTYITTLLAAIGAIRNGNLIAGYKRGLEVGVNIELWLQTHPINQYYITLVQYIRYIKLYHLYYNRYVSKSDGYYKDTTKPTSTGNATIDENTHQSTSQQGTNLTFTNERVYNITQFPSNLPIIDLKSPLVQFLAQFPTQSSINIFLLNRLESTLISMLSTTTSSQLPTMSNIASNGNNSGGSVPAPRSTTMPTAIINPLWVQRNILSLPSNDLSSQHALVFALGVLGYEVSADLEYISEQMTSHIKIMQKGHLSVDKQSDIGTYHLEEESKMSALLALACVSRGQAKRQINSVCNDLLFFGLAPNSSLSSANTNTTNTPNGLLIHDYVTKVGLHGNPQTRALYQKIELLHNIDIYPQTSYMTIGDERLTYVTSDRNQSHSAALITLGINNISTPINFFNHIFLSFLTLPSATATIRLSAALGLGMMHLSRGIYGMDTVGESFAIVQLLFGIIFAKLTPSAGNWHLVTNNTTTITQNNNPVNFGSDITNNFLPQNSQNQRLKKQKQLHKNTNIAISNSHFSSLILNTNQNSHVGINGEIKPIHVGVPSGWYIHENTKMGAILSLFLMFLQTEATYIGDGLWNSMVREEVIIADNPTAYNNIGLQFNHFNHNNNNFDHVEIEDDEINYNIDSPTNNNTTTNDDNKNKDKFSKLSQLSKTSKLSRTNNNYSNNHDLDQTTTQNPKKQKRHQNTHIISCSPFITQNYSLQVPVSLAITSPAIITSNNNPNNKTYGLMQTPIMGQHGVSPYHDNNPRNGVNNYNNTTHLSPTTTTTGTNNASNISAYFNAQNRHSIMSATSDNTIYSYLDSSDLNSLRDSYNFSHNDSNNNTDDNNNNNNQQHLANIYPNHHNITSSTLLSRAESSASSYSQLYNPQQHMMHMNNQINIFGNNAQNLHSSQRFHHALHKNLPPGSPITTTVYTNPISLEQLDLNRPFLNGLMVFARGMVMWNEMIDAFARHISTSILPYLNQLTNVIDKAIRYRQHNNIKTKKERRSVKGEVKINNQNNDNINFNSSTLAQDNPLTNAFFVPDKSTISNPLLSALENAQNEHDLSKMSSSHRNDNQNVNYENQGTNTVVDHAKHSIGFTVDMWLQQQLPLCTRNATPLFTSYTQNYIHKHQEKYHSVEKPRYMYKNTAKIANIARKVTQNTKSGPGFYDIDDDNGYDSGYVSSTTRKRHIIRSNHDIDDESGNDVGLTGNHFVDHSAHNAHTHNHDKESIRALFKKDKNQPLSSNNDTNGDNNYYGDGTDNDDDEEYYYNTNDRFSIDTSDKNNSSGSKRGTKRGKKSSTNLSSFGIENINEGNEDEDDEEIDNDFGYYRFASLPINITASTIGSVDSNATANSSVNIFNSTVFNTSTSPNVINSNLSSRNNQSKQHNLPITTFNGLDTSSLQFSDLSGQIFTQQQQLQQQGLLPGAIVNIPKNQNIGEGEDNTSPATQTEQVRIFQSLLRQHRANQIPNQLQRLTLPEINAYKNAINIIDNLTHRYHNYIIPLIHNYLSIIAHGCFAIGFRFAGSGNTVIRDLLLHYLMCFHSILLLKNDVIAASAKNGQEYNTNTYLSFENDNVYHSMLFDGHGNAPPHILRNHFCIVDNNTTAPRQQHHQHQSHPSSNDPDIIQQYHTGDLYVYSQPHPTPVFFYSEPLYQQYITKTNSYTNTIISSMRSHIDDYTLTSTTGMVAVAVGLVMCGTGDLNSLTLLRRVRKNTHPELPYSQQQPVSQAIGLLTLGGCTMSIESTSPSNLTMLFLSLFPRYSHQIANVNDYLQNLRFFHALAIAPRSFVTVDFSSKYNGSSNNGGNGGFDGDSEDQSGSAVLKHTQKGNSFIGQITSSQQCNGQNKPIPANLTIVVNDLDAIQMIPYHNINHNNDYHNNNNMRNNQFNLTDTHNITDELSDSNSLSLDNIINPKYQHHPQQKYTSILTNNIIIPQLRTITTTAPCLLPPLKSIVSITITSPGYTPAHLTPQNNPHHLWLICNQSVFYLKKISINWLCHKILDMDKFIITTNINDYIKNLVNKVIYNSNNNTQSSHHNMVSSNNSLTTEVQYIAPLLHNYLSQYEISQFLLKVILQNYAFSTIKSTNILSSLTILCSTLPTLIIDTMFGYQQPHLESILTSNNTLTQISSHLSFFGGEKTISKLYQALSLPLPPPLGNNYHQIRYSILFLTISSLRNTLSSSKLSLSSQLTSSNPYNTTTSRVGSDVTPNELINKMKMDCFDGIKSHTTIAASKWTPLDLLKLFINVLHVANYGDDNNTTDVGSWGSIMDLENHQTILTTRVSLLFFTVINSLYKSLAYLHTHAYMGAYSNTIKSNNIDGDGSGKNNNTFTTRSSTTTQTKPSNNDIVDCGCIRFNQSCLYQLHNDYVINSNQNNVLSNPITPNDLYTLWFLIRFIKQTWCDGGKDQTDVYFKTQKNDKVMTMKNGQENDIFENPNSQVTIDQLNNPHLQFINMITSQLTHLFPSKSISDFIHKSNDTNNHYKNDKNNQYIDVFSSNIVYSLRIIYRFLLIDTCYTPTSPHSVNITTLPPSILIHLLNPRNYAIYNYELREKIKNGQDNNNNNNNNNNNIGNNQPQNTKTNMTQPNNNTNNQNTVVIPPQPIMKLLKVEKTLPSYHNNLDSNSNHGTQDVNAQYCSICSKLIMSPQGKHQQPAQIQGDNMVGTCSGHLVMPNTTETYIASYLQCYMTFYNFPTTPIDTYTLLKQLTNTIINHIGQFYTTVIGNYNNTIATNKEHIHVNTNGNNNGSIKYSQYDINYTVNMIKFITKFKLVLNNQCHSNHHLLKLINTLKKRQLIPYSTEHCGIVITAFDIFDQDTTNNESLGGANNTNDEKYSPKTTSLLPTTTTTSMSNNGKIVLTFKKHNYFNSTALKQTAGGSGNSNDSLSRSTATTTTTTQAQNHIINSALLRPLKFPSLIAMTKDIFGLHDEYTCHILLTALGIIGDNL